MAAMNQKWFPRLSLFSLLLCSAAAAQEAQIIVHANQVSHRLSRYLTGACIEDVNHEIYGGLYSQMIFGESFQEPAPGDAGTIVLPNALPAQAVEKVGPSSGVSGQWRAFALYP